MKCSLTYAIKIQLIEDEILKKLNDLLNELKSLFKTYKLIEDKYSDDEYIANYDISVRPIEYKSHDNKVFLKFIYDNNLRIGQHIILFDSLMIGYDKNDFKNVKYFLLHLNQYENNMSERCETYNFEKMRLVPLTEDFATFDNTENLISNKAIVKKVQFQGYYNGWIELYFISKYLGEFILKHNFTGFQLKPVYKINTDEVLFYQLKVTNVIEAPSIVTEIASLNKEEVYVYPKKDSKLYNFYIKNIDVKIYDKNYIKNNFCDFNMYYYSHKDAIYENKRFTGIELVVSERVLVLFKHYKMKSFETSIYSTEYVNIDMYKLDEEVKELTEKCRTNR